MLRRGLGVAGAIASGMLACSLATSLDGLSGTPPARLPDVQTVPAVDGGGSPTDSSNAGDGGDAASLDAGVYCETVQPDAAYCADYDEGDVLLAYEHGVLTRVANPQTCAGCLASDDAGGHASPAAFLVQVPALDGGLSGSVKDYFDRPAVLPATAATLRFDMQLLQLTDVKEIDFVALRLLSADSGTEVDGYVVVESGLASLSIEGTSDFQRVPITIPADRQWHTYAVDLTASPSQVSLSIDDGPAVAVSVPSSFTATHTSFDVGPVVYSPSAPIRIAFDNVVLISR